jgi:hypothetical protein
MSDNFNSTLRDLYSVRLDQAPNVDVQVIPGNPVSVKLVLSLRGPTNLRESLAKPPQGAILDVHMGKSEAMEVFEGIRRVARQMGWPLP